MAAAPPDPLLPPLAARGWNTLRRWLALEFTESKRVTLDVLRMDRRESPTETLFSVAFPLISGAAAARAAVPAAAPSATPNPTPAKPEPADWHPPADGWPGQAQPPAAAGTAAADDAGGPTADPSALGGLGEFGRPAADAAAAGASVGAVVPGGGDSSSAGDDSRWPGFGSPPAPAGTTTPPGYVPPAGPAGLNYTPPDTSRLPGPVPGKPWAQPAAVNKVAFEPNVGQAGDGGTAYLARGRGYAVHLRADGATFVVARAAEGGDATREGAGTIDRHAVRLSLVGANPAAAAAAEDRQAGRANYYTGAGEHSGVPRYGRVRFAGVYPGVDAVYRQSAEGSLEYDFEVAAGASAGAIALRVDGADGWRVADDGSLRIRTSVGELTHRQPVAYQEAAGRRAAVPTWFVPRADGTVGFGVGAYDRARPLVVDPVVQFAAVVGGSGGDAAVDATVDAAGNTVFTGWTVSPGLPAQLGAAAASEEPDAYVAKVSPAGQVLFTTYLGGSGTEYGLGVTTDAAGNVYVTGVTDSGAGEPSGGGEVWVTAGRDADEEGERAGWFTVRRADGAGELTVNYASPTGAAALGEDYLGPTAGGGSVTFADGQVAVRVEVRPFDDGFEEGPESVELTLAAGAGYTLGDQDSAAIDVLDNDPASSGGGSGGPPASTPRVWVTADRDATEQASQAGWFTVRRTHAGSPLTVLYSAAGGTASWPSDYTSPLPLAGGVTFGPGESEKRVYVTPVDDTVVEPTENVRLRLLPWGGYTVASPQWAKLNVLDNDTASGGSGGTVWVTKGADAAEEGEAAGRFIVHRSVGTGTVVVGYSGSGGSATAGADYSGVPVSGGTVVFGPGVYEKEVYVEPADDDEDEADETVVLTLLTGSGYTLGTPSSETVTIYDNDAPPGDVDEVGVWVTAGRDAAEGQLMPGWFLFRRTSGAGALAVGYTVGGSATPGTDYGTLSGTVVFPEGQTVVPVYVRPVDDAAVEGTETVTVSLTTGAGYVVAAPAGATVRLFDDDFGSGGGEVGVWVTGDRDAEEQDEQTGWFTFHRTSGAGTLTVTYDTGGSATPGTDYTGPPSGGGTVVFAPGEWEKRVEVTPDDDTLVEGDESVTLTVVAGTGYVPVTTAEDSITIVDNDLESSGGGVRVWVTGDRDAEEQDEVAGWFTVRRSSGTGTLTVNYDAPAGTATLGTDYTGPASGGGTVSFADGQTEVLLYAYPDDDAAVEGPETVEFTLATGSGYSLAFPAWASVAILDNDGGIPGYSGGEWGGFAPLFEPMSGPTSEEEWVGFPVTAGAYKTSQTAGVRDHFVAKLSADGELVYATLLDGTATAAAEFGDTFSSRDGGIAVAPSGEVVVTGTTGNASFPLVNPSQGTFGSGGTDAVVVRLDAYGKEAVFATFFGGSGADRGHGVALDPGGNAWVVGGTASANLPTVNPFQATLSGGSGGADGFIARFTAAGARAFATYDGTSGTDEALGVAAYDGGVVVAGTGGGQAVVRRVAGTGAAGYRTEVGPGEGEAVAADPADPSGAVWVGGTTSSTSFPLVDADQPAYGGGASDGFVARLTPAGAVDAATYAGGSGGDGVHGLGAYFDEVSAVGTTTSGNFPVTHTPQATDAFVVRYAPRPPAPVVTAVTDDTGASAEDRLTNDTTLTVAGTARAGLTVVVSLAPAATGVPADVGTVTANGSGAWSFAMPSAVAEGRYTFTARAVQSGIASWPSDRYAIEVDTTAPDLVVDAPEETTARTPEITISGSDLNGLATTVTLDVDRNNDNDFSDADETAAATGTWENGTATVTPEVPLAVGQTVKLRARADDAAGNAGTSPLVTMTVVPGSGLTDLTPNLLLAAGDGDSLLFAGTARNQVALDLDLSPGTSASRNPALVYDSSTASPVPVVQVRYQPDTTLTALPTAVTATYTWDGAVVQAGVSLPVGGLVAGEPWVFAFQPAGAQPTGRHTYTVDLFVDYPGTADDETLYLGPDPAGQTGFTFVVDNTQSPFGAGWAFSNTDRLYDVPADGGLPAGLLRAYGRGGWGFYASVSGGGYDSPPGDFGTLQAAGGGWKYTGVTKWSQTFDSGGRTTGWSNPDGTELFTYTYDGGGRLSTAAGPDGGLATFAYDANGKVESITAAAGLRVTALTHSGGPSGDLIAVTSPVGGVRTLAYAGHKLALDSNGVATTRLGYAASGAVSWVRAGDDPNTTVRPRLSRGLTAPFVGTADGPWGELADPLAHTTRGWFDRGANPVLQAAADGAVTRWERDAERQPTEVSQPLGRTLGYEYDALGQLTGERLADGSRRTYTYDPTWRTRATAADELGRVTTYAYHSTTGRLLTVTTPDGQGTTNTWTAGGLLQTVTDPLGRITTHAYDAARRKTHSVRPDGSLSVTAVYDARGEAAGTVDQLGRVTTTAYDAAGRLAVSADAAGATTTYAYDAAGRLMSQVAPTGRRTVSVYDAAGRPVRQIDAAGTPLARATGRVYDAAGRQVATVDPLGVRTTTAYDAVGRAVWTQTPVGESGSVYDLAGRVVVTIDPTGRTTASGYDLRDRPTVSLDPVGARTTTAYDRAGNATAVTDAVGAVRATEYDRLNRATRGVDPLGHQTVTQYDVAGQVTAVLDPLGRPTTSAFDRAGRLTATTDPLGGTGWTAYDLTDRATATADPLARSSFTAYDAAGRVTATLDPGGGRATTVYDAAGRQVAVIDPLGRRTTTLYDTLDRPTASVDPLGRVTVTQYDPRDAVRAVFDPLGRLTVHEYDPANRRVGTRTPLGAETRTVYDAAGRTVLTLNPLGQGQSTEYDGAGRPVSSTDPLGHVTRAVFDAAGRQVASADQRGNVTTTVYDPAGRATQRIDPLGRSSFTAYDAAGQTTAVTDPLGRTSWTEYDRGGRATEQTDPLGRQTTAAYDAVGNQTAATDARGFRTSVAFDALNRPTASQDQLGRVSGTGYDPVGNATVRVDPLGRTATTVYDPLNRATASIDPLNHRTTVAFDVAGQRTASLDQLGRTTTTVYDLAGRAAVTIDPLNRRTTTVFDLADRPLTTRDPAGNGPWSFYDAAGRAVATADARGYLTRFTLDAAGNQVGVLDPRGNFRQSAYDPLNRATASTDPFTQTGTVAFDAAGQQTASVDPLNRRTTTAYDLAGRATAVQDPLGRISYTAYDVSGNATATTDPLGRVTTSQYDPLNRATAVFNPLGQRTASEFDVAGQQTASVDPLNRRTTTAYDPAGRATAATDALGRTSTTGFDAAGNATVSVDPLTRRTTVSYDALNRPTETRDPQNNRTTTVYDLAGNREAVIDPLNRRTTTAYDADRRPVATTNALNQATVTAYDAAGNAVAVTDPLGRTSVSVYDALNRAVAQVNPLGHRSTVVFDAVGNATATADPLGRWSLSNYDRLNRVTESINPLNQRTTTAFDVVGNATLVTDPLSGTVGTLYDALNRAVARADQLGHHTTTAYDTVGNTTGTVNELGIWSYTAYDALSRPTLSTDALNQLTTTAYDLVGNATLETDPQSGTVATLYDLLNRATGRIDQLSGRTTVAFDVAGNRTANADALGRWATAVYDALSRATVSVDQLGRRTTTAYDAVSNATLVTDPSGVQTQYAFDAAGRSTGSLNSLGQWSYTRYDSAGQVTEAVDTLGRVTTTLYDLAGRATQTIDPMGQRTTTVYDAGGRRLALVDASNNVTTWAYDARGLVVGETNPNNKTATYAYDVAGRQTSATDRIGRRIDSAYDDLGRKTSERWYAVGGSLVQEQTFGYDWAGRLAVAADPDGTYTMSYDLLGRVTHVAEPFGQSLDFQYDAAGRRTRVADSQGGVTTSTYDDAGQLASRAWNGTGASTGQGMVTYAYDPRGRVTSQSRFSDAAGTTRIGDTANGYDDLGRLVERSHHTSAGTTLTYGTYTYDHGDRLTGKTEDGTPTAYQYDATDQLTKDGANATITYDGTGNRTNSGYSTTTGNRMTADGVWTWTYDDAGQVTGRSQSGESWAYEYDHRGQMTVAVRTVGGSEAGRVTYSYDAFGNRIARADGAGTEWYAVDGWDPQKGGGKGTEAFDVWADLRAGDGLLLARRVSDGGWDTPLARQVTGGAVSWYVTDHQGSVRRVLDNSGAVSGTLAYDAFGKQTTATGLIDRYRFTAREWDAVIQLQYSRARVYDVDTGRWLSSDPMGFAAGDTNLYRYVGNQATTATDPSGNALIAKNPKAKSAILKRLEQNGIRAAGYSLSFNGIVEGKQVGRYNPGASSDRYLIHIMSDDHGKFNKWAEATWRDDESGGYKTAASRAIVEVGFDIELDENLTYAGTSMPEWGFGLANRHERQLIPGIVKGAAKWEETMRERALQESQRSEQAELEKKLWKLRVMIAAERGIKLPEEPPTQNRQDTFPQSSMSSMTRQEFERNRQELERQQKKYEDDIRLRGHVVGSMMQAFPGARPYDDGPNGVIAQADALARRDAAERFARLTATEQFVVQFIELAAMFALTEGVGGLAFGGLRVTTAAGGGLRVARAGELVEFSISDVSAVRSRTPFATRTTPKTWQDFLTESNVGGATWSARGGMPAELSHTELGSLRAALDGETPALGRVPGDRCFAAGTPLLTPTGSKRIEEFVAGDFVLSRDQFDPAGVIQSQLVEKVFLALGRVLILRVGCQTIRTTEEHPFWVVGKGWLPARELIAGDRLLSHDGAHVVVSEVAQTDEWEAVYNLRVADDHTYFVGCDEWGFSVWAHNACCTAEEVRSVLDVAGTKVDSTTASKIGNAIRKDHFDTVTKLLEPLGVKATGQEFLHKVEVYRALRETGMSHAEMVGYYKTLGEPYLFRGTTEGYPGNHVMQTLGISPASIDPVVATVFAVQSRNYAANAQVQFGRQAAIVDTLGVGNVLRVTEREVAVPLAPAAFEAKAPHRIPVDQARAILAEPAIGIDVPAGFSHGMDRSFLLAYEAGGKRLTPAQIQYFLNRATGGK